MNVYTASWVKAAALKYGTLLRTPGGGTTAVLGGGYTPAPTTGWIWDLTIVSDHVFYISTGSTTVLVHNCGTIPARSVRFTQDSISQSFRDGCSVMQLGEDLANGTISPEALPPIRIFERNGNLYSLDNRRLLAGQMADVELPYRMATPEEVATELPRKLTTQNEGTGFYVRRVGYFSWSQP